MFWLLNMHLSSGRNFFVALNKGPFMGCNVPTMELLNNGQVRLGGKRGQFLYSCSMETLRPETEFSSIEIFHGHLASIILTVQEWPCCFCLCFVWGRLALAVNIIYSTPPLTVFPLLLRRTLDWSAFRYLVSCEMEILYSCGYPVVLLQGGPSTPNQRADQKPGCVQWECVRMVWIALKNECEECMFVACVLVADVHYFFFRRRHPTLLEFAPFEKSYTSIN